MYVCMDVWMYGKSQVNIVLNEMCTQLRMLRCKIYVVVFLGEVTLRTSAAWICFLENIKITRHTNVCVYRVVFIFILCIYIYLNVVYIYILYIYVSFAKQQTIKNNVCMCGCMHGCMYGKITNKQSIDWNMFTTWDASLQDLCGRIPRGT